MSRRDPRWSRSRAPRIFLHLLLVALALVFVFPFLWMFTTSIKTDEEMQIVRLVQNVSKGSS